jgi:hypothetical protein
MPDPVSNATNDQGFTASVILLVIAMKYSATTPLRLVTFSGVAMKNLIAVAVVSIVVCTQIVAQSSRPKLFDFRLEARNKPPRVTAATSRKVLCAVFP